MTVNVNKVAASQAKADNPLGQCCHITLSNGVEALYLNGEFITDAEPADGVPSLLPLARSIARASDCLLNCYAVHEPKDEEWAWNDVVDEIQQRKRDEPEALVPYVFTPDSPDAPRGFLTKLLALRK
ncbi:hypothetical protein [Candidatus Pantoea bituminis]|uniref:hypothetical protein n=1 Tax=Candidatus Pantoea bituminis TaxID=2831036 RepID=UPI001C060BD3|nr:hypothetical protein [Pantoea bituminis]